jgi:hypothetical protein
LFLGRHSAQQEGQAKPVFDAIDKILTLPAFDRKLHQSHPQRSNCTMVLLSDHYFLEQNDSLAKDG